MVTQQDLERLGEEIFKLIKDTGIQLDAYSIGITISRDEYERIKEGLAGSKVDVGLALGLTTRTWAIQLNYPFLEVNPIDTDSSQPQQ